MKIKNFILAATLICGIAGSALADQVAQSNDTFVLHGLTAANYRPGTTQYLVYSRDIESGKVTRMELWNRTTRLIEKDGKKLVETTQDWHLTGLTVNREIYSLNALDTFAPIYHRTINGADKVVSAYTFSGTKITGDKSLENNSKADFSMEQVAATLNWELDMETFGLLPLQKGRTFRLNFYHPGSKTPPSVYDYTVTGEETLTDVRGEPLECWVLHIQYGDEGDANFWIAKDSRETMKMVERWGKHHRYKVRLGVPLQEGNT